MKGLGSGAWGGLQHYCNVRGRIQMSAAVSEALIYVGGIPPWKALPYIVQTAAVLQLILPPAVKSI